jgi:phenylacetate-CoA ligase
MFNTEQPIPDQARWLMREDPDYLISVASNVQELARHCGRQGLRPPRLREVRSYGEALHPDARAEIRAAWGVPVVDMYSCREAGYLALQCPQHEHYHVQAEGIYLELLDGQDKPAAPGTLGRVVITVLHNFAMPLIRYDIGDYAEAGEPCDCGRKLPVIRRIVGRVRNMLTLPDGSLRHPRFGEAQFGSIAPVRQFQVVQKSLEDIEVALVVARPLTAGEEMVLRALIVKNLKHPFNVSFVYRDGIPRSAGGKYEDFRSDVTT